MPFFSSFLLLGSIKDCSLLSPFEFGFECLRLPNIGGFVEGSSVKFLILSSRGYFVPGLYYQLRQFILLFLVHASCIQRWMHWHWVLIRTPCHLRLLNSHSVLFAQARRLLGVNWGNLIIWRDFLWYRKSWVVGTARLTYWNSFVPWFCCLFGHSQRSFPGIHDQVIFSCFYLKLMVRDFLCVNYLILLIFLMQTVVFNCSFLLLFECRLSQGLMILDSHRIRGNDDAGVAIVGQLEWVSFFFFWRGAVFD